MSFYHTPIKAVQKKSGQNYTQDRPTDWICIVCNNLNFSFRKKCNRCKTQTRVQNQNQMVNAYSDYFYAGSNYLSVNKYPLEDVTNCHTPQEKYLKSQPKPVQPFSLAFSQSNLMSNSSRPLKITMNILDSECWDSIHNDNEQNERTQQLLNEIYQKNNDQSKQTSKNDKSESKNSIKQKIVCQFTDNELQCLINKVLIED